MPLPLAERLRRAALEIGDRQTLLALEAQARRETPPGAVTIGGDGANGLRRLVVDLFGEAVGIVEAPSPEAAIAAASASGADALVSAADPRPWWRALGAGQRVVEKLPLVGGFGAPYPSAFRVSGPGQPPPATADARLLVLSGEGFDLAADMLALVRLATADGDALCETSVAVEDADIRDETAARGGRISTIREIGRFERPLLFLDPTGRKRVKA